MAKHKTKAFLHEADESEAVGETNDVQHQAKTQGTLKRFHLRKLFSTKKRRIVAIIIAAALIVSVVFAIPPSRYFLLGWVVKKDVSLSIIDSTTKRPISDAVVSLGDVSARSDKNGVATLKAVRVGEFTLKITKQYYADTSTSYTVPVIFSPASPTLTLVAIGRQVTVSVTNKITGDPVDGLLVSASGTSATTNSDGTAVIILPTTDNIQKATLKRTGYNDANVELNVNDVTATNAYSVTPAGYIYYLSKASGNIDVMKANLDGSGASNVVAGTGQESITTTSLFSSRDWKYSVLQANRTDNKERLYLIDASTNKMSLIDQSDARFSIVGWAGHNLIYIVYRHTTNVWDNKNQAIKSFNADTGNTITLDETSGPTTGWAYDALYSKFGDVYIVNNEVIYSITWRYVGYFYGDPHKNDVIASTDASTGIKKTIKEFAVPATVSTTGGAFIYLQLYMPQETIIAFQASGSNLNTVFYLYANNSVKPMDNMNIDKYYGGFPTYLISPSGNKTLWSESRDGKNRLFIGDRNAGNATEIGSLSDYTPYGWFGSNDEYIIFTKKGSELYIAPANKPIDSSNLPLKVTDYQMTRAYRINGHGYGG